MVSVNPLTSVVIVVLFAFELLPAQGSSLESASQALKYCMDQSSTVQCLKQKIISNLDKALKDNSTWHLGDYLSLEKDLGWSKQGRALNESDSVGDFQSKFLNLVESRSLKVKVSPLMEFEGRKKKFKGGKGGMGMMGGIAIIGMMAQMVIGKLVMLSGAAFVLAKIALIWSILSSFRNNKSSGSNTEHVIYADSGSSHSSGGGSHSSGWQRSMPDYDPYSYPGGEYPQSP